MHLFDKICIMVHWLSKFSKESILHAHRSVSKVHDEWFADEEKVRKAVGLPEKPVIEYPNAKEVNSLFFRMIMKFWHFLLILIWCCNAPESHMLLSYSNNMVLFLWQLNCGICFETYPCKEMHAAACGHPFCYSCWAGLIYMLKLFSFPYSSMLLFPFSITWDLFIYEKYVCNVIKVLSRILLFVHIANIYAGITMAALKRQELLQRASPVNCSVGLLLSQSYLLSSHNM